MLRTIRIIILGLVFLVQSFAYAADFGTGTSSVATDTTTASSVDPMKLPKLTSQVTDFA